MRDAPCFNTQPPVGGWRISAATCSSFKSFQHAAARRRLGPLVTHSATTRRFQHAAARRRLANCALIAPSSGSFNTQPPVGGWLYSVAYRLRRLCFNTQPPVGGWTNPHLHRRIRGRFNTQPPVGGWYLAGIERSHTSSFNTQPPVGGWASHTAISAGLLMFQHAAARRRLGNG